MLDLGCGPGYIARELLAKGCQVVGVDAHPAPAENVNDFIRWELGTTDELPFHVSDFDDVLLLDVIEHLDDPERFMRNLRRGAGLDPPRILLSVPNVGYLPMRLMLLLGQFNYGPEGILDFTHRRLYTYGSLVSMLRQEGYLIHQIRGVPAPFPKALGLNGVSMALLRINEWLIKLSRRLFSYQLFLVCKG